MGVFHHRQRIAHVSADDQAGRGHGMSDAQSKIKIFESQQIRTEWDAEAEKWWFSVLDVMVVLTEQTR